MGKSATRLTKAESDLRNEIQELNKLTRSKQFEKRAGLMLNFSYSSRRKQVKVLLVRFILT
jgi:hypothetical protein